MLSIVGSALLGVVVLGILVSFFALSGLLFAKISGSRLLRNADFWESATLGLLIPLAVAIAYAIGSETLLFIGWGQ